jgi:hypothetical protein
VQQEIAELQTLTVALCQRGMEREHWETLQGVLTGMAHAEPVVDPLALSDREEAVAGWLEAHGVEDAWAIAPELARGGLGEPQLQDLAATLPQAALDGSFTWLSKSRAVADLVHTIAVSTHSISDLVGAVKEYSYMDRAPEQEVDIHQGIESTLRILAPRAS